MKKRLTIFLLTLTFITIIVSFAVAMYAKQETFEGDGFCENVFSQEPIISLIAPEKAKIGELVILDASNSVAISFAWSVIPETKDFEIIEDGKRAFFTSRRSGTYLFVIAAAKNNTVSIVIHELQITGSEDKFTVLIKSWLPENPDPLLLQALARSFMASSKAESIETLVKQTSVTNQAVLGPKLSQYTPFLKKFSEYLKTNYNDKSLEEHITLWLKLAETLKSC